MWTFPALWPVDDTLGRFVKNCFRVFFFFMELSPQIEPAFWSFMGTTFFFQPMRPYKNRVLSYPERGLKWVEYICILCLIIILCTHVRSRHMFRFFSKLPHMYLPLCIVKLILDFHKKKGREREHSFTSTYKRGGPLSLAEWSKMVKWWGGSLDALEYGNQNSPRCQELWSGCRLTVGLLWVLWKFEISETTVHKGKNWKQ